MKTKHLQTGLRRFGVTASACALTACGTLGTSQNVPTASLPPAQAGVLQSCADLPGKFAFDNTRINSAETVAAGTIKHGDRPLPAHCLVKGQMYPRKGSDGHDYAIGFEMRLPLAWSGRFYYQGNGGLDGAVLPALGALGGGPLTGALMQGFAVISSDAGHSGAQTPFFGAEPQARLDYGYQAVAKLTPMAKQLIRSAYGKTPDRSYIGGCSNGGRHTLVAASRLGDQYDGYLIGAPGYRLPYAAIAQIWGVQQWSSLATPGATIPHPMNPKATIPDLGSALTPTERRTLAGALLQKCDALDGARDGLIQSSQACQRQFDVARDVPTCSAKRDGNCLTAAQKKVVAAVHAGARSPSGEAFYSPFPWDAGIVGADWAGWKFVNSIVRDPLAAGMVFGVPPAQVDPFKANVDTLLARVRATDGTYRESGVSLMMPPQQENPANLGALRARGAKMILYHGVSDAIFSAEDTRQWYLRLDKTQDGKAADFARFFPVPGMSHCSGGPTADQFDLLTPLVAWVEHGQAPQAVVAGARGAANSGGVNKEVPAGWSAGRTRPLCAYPSVAHYNGSGSLEDAANFTCRN
jgi:feruloyl esterase